MDNKNLKVVYDKGLSKPTLKPAFLLDDFFHHFFSDQRPMFNDGTLLPSIDLVSKDDKYVLKAELQGVKKEDIEVEIADHYVVLKAEKRQDEECKDCDYYYKETSSGKMMREIQIPEKIDKNKSEVEFKEGILTIRMPKAEETKTRKVKL
jgi:HSP20 family protein